MNNILEVIIPALILGLMGSFHCLGMCGPLVFSLSLKENRHRRFVELGRAVYYNLMRVVSYLIIGIFMGMVGEGMRTMSAQRFVSIFSGLVLIVWALWYKKVFFFAIKGKLDLLISKAIGYFSKKFKKNNLWHLGLMGLLNGWLPCGLVYVAAAAALSYGRLDLSLEFMFFFGLGTFPMMVASFFLFSRINQKIRHKINLMIPFLIFILGCLFVLRGMDLGIPFISPKMGAHSHNSSM